MAKTNLHQGLFWRISLFPSIPISAFFSLIVFTRNYFSDTRNFHRYVILFLSCYFLIFSGSRSAFIALTITFLIHFVSKIIGFYGFHKYVILSLFSLSLVILINIFSPTKTVLSGTNGNFLRSFIFKTNNPNPDSKKVQEKNYRTWIWSKHLNIYKENLIIGRGDYNFVDFISEKEKAKWRTGYSESFFTNLLVEVGLLAFLFLGFVLQLIKTALSKNNPAFYSLIVSFLILMFLYGSFIVPYNLIFLLFAGSINLPDPFFSNQ